MKESTYIAQETIPAIKGSGDRTKEQLPYMTRRSKARVSFDKMQQGVQTSRHRL